MARTLTKLYYTQATYLRALEQHNVFLSLSISTSPQPQSRVSSRISLSFNCLPAPTFFPTCSSQPLSWLLSLQLSHLSPRINLELLHPTRARCFCKVRIQKETPTRRLTMCMQSAGSDASKCLRADNQNGAKVVLDNCSGVYHNIS